MNVDIPTLVEEEVRTEIFYPYIDSHDHGVILEIGTFVGGNLLRVADYIRQSNKVFKLYGIDNFEFENVSAKGMLNTGVNKNMHHNSYYNQLMDNIDKYDLQEYVIILDGDSIELSKTWNEYIDLIFIDGAHSYDYCKKELQAWLPHVKLGGIVSGHDFPADGIRKNIFETFPNHQITETSTKGAYYTIK